MSKDCLLILNHYATAATGSQVLTVMSIKCTDQFEISTSPTPPATTTTTTTILFLNMVEFCVSCHVKLTFAVSFNTGHLSLEQV